MSEHVVEDMVADSVLLLDRRYPAEDGRVRDWIVTLYRFQEGHDCSFTHFRVMDVLLRRGCAYRFPIERHPDYSTRREYFDSLKEFTGLKEFDEEAEDFEGYDSWLDEGYVEPPHLYCDAGTSLWQRMAREGLLQGADATAPRRAPLVEVVHAIAVAAEQEGDRELIALWYAFGAELLLADHPGRPFDVTELDELPETRELREIVRRTDAMTVDLPGGHLAPPEILDSDDPETWWWDL